VLLGGVGHFRNAEHFLEVSVAAASLAGPRAPPGLTGCVRRLEINDRLYNFASVEKGGDANSGVDIGKMSIVMSCKGIHSHTFFFLTWINYFLKILHHLMTYITLLPLYFNIYRII